MKKLLILVLLPLSSLSWGQNKEAAKADKLFSDRSYVEAAKMYLTLTPTQKILQNLGDSYYFNSEMTFAIETYEKLVLTHKDTIQPEYYYRYAQALMGANDYKKADVMMAKYLGYPTDTEKFRENLNKTNTYNYEVKKIGKAKNTGDFGLNYWGSKVVFASTRDAKGEPYGWNKKPYLDLFEGTISKDGDIQAVKPFPKEINSKKHESSATFSADGKVMYFNRNNEHRVKVGNEKISQIKIFRAEFINGKWDKVTVTPFSGDAFSTQHPALSKDGKRLFFASDRPGSLGSFDIYYVDILENGTYSEPVNLGSNVNSKLRDQFPYVDEDNTLYFSSDGHQGLGGLDIFMSKFTDNAYAKAVNLGGTINTGMDDFAFVLDKKNDTGYLSSNRGGADDIYSFKREENENRLIVEGTIVDKHTNEPLAGTTITFFGEADHASNDSKDNKAGKDGKASQSSGKTGAGAKEDYTFPTDPNKKYKLLGQTVVGEKGDYTFPTEANKNYKIIAEKDFYIPYSENIKTDADGKAKFNIELEIESFDDAEEIVVTKPDGNVYIELENIYFDFNKYEITPEAGKTLDVLVELMEKYPSMDVQLGAHTDTRASATYNLQLSHYRAKAAKDYLIENGIDAKRLRSKGYGESKPLVNCGDHCTEAENSINRRCEFIILK